MSMGAQKSGKGKSNVPHKTKLKKDPGVPRLPNLKNKHAEKQRLQAARATPRTQARTDNDAVMASEPTLSSLAMLAAASSTSGPGSSAADADLDPVQRTKEQVRRHYVRTLHKVIEESDVVVMVLDARDPEGSRSRLVEEEVRRREGEGKKLVLVLNKIDLVPRPNAEAWLRYLRHSTPTLPFRSAQQQQRTNLSSNTAPTLLRLLKGYKPSSQSITVGVVGYPNVGKSSLINSLKRAKVCAVAATPGHTKEMQSVQVERGIRVLDSPGVIFDDDDQASGNLLLRNVVKVEDIDDPIAVVEQILARTTPEIIQKTYNNIPPYTSTLEFLTILALTNGRLLKGGTPDIISTARTVINDWNQHKIPFFTNPPTIHASSVPSTIKATGEVRPGAENVGQAQILEGLGKPFELEGLFGAADAGAFGDAPMEEEPGEGEELMEEDGNEMESDDIAPAIPRKRSRSASPTLSLAPSTLGGRERTRPIPKRIKKDIPSYDAPMEEHVRARTAGGNPLSRKVLKQEAKRARKDARRAAKAAGAGMEVDDALGEGLQFTFMVGEGGFVTA